MTGFKNIDVTELQAMLAAGRICLVDVRTDAEIARGYINGAMKLPLHLLPMRLHELDAKVPTVFYCQMGGRSAQAAAFSAAQGFTEAYNLQGGITAWARSGGPITA
ncbi:MAG: rhodanese-like domain-containing protein [Sideroxydans sp.]|nr:rhodanese-like domain-containing protein [Sideroxydans sp.]